MNLSGRLTRAEKAIGPAAKGGPARMAGLIRYFKTGNPADIPPDVKGPELQAAARRTPRGAELTLKGLGIIREAFGKTLTEGESILERIAANPLCVRNCRVKDNEKPPADPQADLMERLGFTVIRIIVTVTSKAEARPE